jgi:hypothetical protein
MTMNDQKKPDAYVRVKRSDLQKLLSLLEKVEKAID